MPTITFTGICTHFRNSTTPLLGGIQHRVVLINANTPTTIAGVNIPPHFATLSLNDAVTPLQGVHLSLGSGNFVNYAPNYNDDVPSLQREMSDIEALPNPSFRLLFDEPWPEVAAYIDINFGTLAPQLTADGAMSVLWTFPDAVTITALPFPGSPVLNPFDGVITLLPDAQLTISNTALPGDEQNSRAHFFLHYKLGVRIPSAPQVPISEQPIGVSATAGSGCSDSNYP